MKTQSYASHRHAPRLTMLGSLFLLLAIVAFGLRGFFDIGGRYVLAVGLFGLIAAIQVLLSISRIYTVRLQDRIILLEMKVRCATLLTPAQQAAFSRLNKAQVVALRFASDAELPALLERADGEKLDPEQIKRAIQHWVPDWNRT